MFHIHKVQAIKLKKDIWFIKAGTIYYYKDDALYIKEPNNEPLRTMDSLAQAIMHHVEPDAEYTDEYIEILPTYKSDPPQYLHDLDGNKYKLVKKAKV